jgi:Pro-kumamolisin, activation domain
VVAVFVRDENGGKIFRRAANRGETRADLARGKSGVNQYAAIFSLDVGAIAGRATAEDGEFDGHEWDDNCLHRIGQIFSRISLKFGIIIATITAMNQYFRIKLQRFFFTAGMSFLLLFAGVFPLVAANPVRQMLHGHVLEVVAHLQPVGLLPPSQRLNLAIGLPLRNEAVLDLFLQQLYDPSSPNYHHYLTPEQFTEKFGPTDQDYQKVIAFAHANGLTVTATHGNRVLLDVSGSVADVERAFQITMRVYQHPKKNRTFYSPDAEPSVDLEVPVADISGLNN